MHKSTRLNRRKKIGAVALLAMVMCGNVMITAMYFPLWLISQPNQIVISAVESMPNSPALYAMRDWKQVAIDLDEFIFDVSKSGQYLPLLEVINESYGTTFDIQTYIGRSYGDNEAVTCLAAVLSATLVGIDKSNQSGMNWVRLCDTWFSPPGLYMNNRNVTSGQSYWYEILPSILLFQRNRNRNYSSRHYSSRPRHPPRRRR